MNIVDAIVKVWETVDNGPHRTILERIRIDFPSKPYAMLVCVLKTPKGLSGLSKMFEDTPIAVSRYGAADDDGFVSRSFTIELGGTEAKAQARWASTTTLDVLLIRLHFLGSRELAQVMRWCWRYYLS